MPRYKVNKRYAAMYNSTRLEYTPGAEVDLPEALAEWLLRDSPDLLSAIEPEPEPTEAETADAEETDEAASDASADSEAAPRRNRQHRPANKRQS